MDGQRFDKLTKTLATGASRRQVIKGLAGGAAGALAAMFGAGRADAACREIRHPCEGNQDCCPGLGCVEASFEGQSERCCPPGQSGCGTECCPIGQCCLQGNQQVCLAAGQCCTAADCPASTDPCKVAACVGNACTFSNVANGTACDDGLFCTTGDTCQGGVCTGGPARDCSAQTDQCNTGVCDEASDACVKQPVANGTGCDDELFCTTGETCQGGVCTGGTPTCDPLQCLTCDEANDICVTTCPVGTQCDGSGNCVNICTKRGQSVFCPSKTGHGFKCCPTDSVCDYSGVNGDVVNCRNI